jgi:hypothetical protein
MVVSGPRKWGNNALLGLYVRPYPGRVVRTPAADGGPALFGPARDPLAAGRPKAVVY